MEDIGKSSIPSVYVIKHRSVIPTENAPISTRLHKPLSDTLLPVVIGNLNRFNLSNTVKVLNIQKIEVKYV